MKISEYLENINSESQKIFEQSISENEEFGQGHHLSSCIFEFSENILDKDEKDMLKKVSTQLESSMMSLALGFYRQAFYSLRLSFEMGLGAVYFSANKLEHSEWIQGKSDIIWSKIMDADSGVLSLRFSDAFFPELSAFVREYREKSSILYRQLSEFVHGNYETWSKSGMHIQYNKKTVTEYFFQYRGVVEILILSLSIRYLKAMPDSSLENLEFVSDEFKHIEAIRVHFGGPK
jgi:hypothetical protein